MAASFQILRTHRPTDILPSALYWHRRKTIMSRYNPIILTVLPKGPGRSRRDKMPGGSRRDKMPELPGTNALKPTRSTITLWFPLKTSQHPNSVTSIDVTTGCVHNSNWKFSSSLLPFRLQPADWLPVLAANNGNAPHAVRATKHTHSTGPTRNKTYAQYRSDTQQNIRTVQVRHATKHTHSTGPTRNKTYTFA